MTYQEEIEMREEREGPRAVANETEALDPVGLEAAARKLHEQQEVDYDWERERDGFIRDAGEIIRAYRAATTHQALAEAGQDAYCPICEVRFRANDMCATDIELGTCHAACLEGSPTVDLETGEPVDGPIPTYPYSGADDGSSLLSDPVGCVTTSSGGREAEARPAATQTALAEAVEVIRPDSIEYHGLDTPKRVCFYEQDFYVLSNFSSFSIQWELSPREGLGRFDTSEAVYHFEKFICRGHVPTVEQRRIANEIRFAPSAHEAFKIAERNKHLRRRDWDDVKVGIMRDILRAKAAQHEYVSRKLLATGDRELVENSWRDDFWGWGPNRDGKNWLGKLWMEVRAELLARHGGKDV